MSSEEILFPTPASPLLTGILLTIGSIYAICCLITMATMILRRHRRLLAVREPFLILLETSFGLFTFIVTMVTIIVGQTPTNCELLNHLYALYLPIWGFPYFLMFPSVVLGSRINQMKVNRHSSHVAPLEVPPAELARNGDLMKGGERGEITISMITPGEGGGRRPSLESDWRWKAKRLATLRSKFLLVFLVSLVHMVAFLCLRYARGGVAGYCLQETLLVICAAEVLYGLLLLYFVIKIFFIQDPFFMKIELIMNSVAFFPILILTFLYPIIPEHFPSFFDVRYAFLAASILGYLFNCLFPTVLSFERVQRVIARRLQLEMSQDELVGLDKKGSYFLEGQFQLNSKEVMKAMLGDQIMLEAFTHYCIQNWCVENVLFFQSANEYASKFGTRGFNAPERAGRIVREFIENRSALEVNIESHLRQAILENYRQGEVSQDLFLRAQQAICELMFSDSFQKWIKTPGFKDALMVCVGTQRKSSSFGNTIKRLERKSVSTGTLRMESVGDS